MQSLCGFFVAATVKLQEFVISESGFTQSKQGSNWQHQLRIASLYPWRIMTSARYVTPSKKYLINCHILLKYFELVFLRLQTMKISCKLIINWVNYETKKKGSLFMKHHVWMTMQWCHCHCDVTYTLLSAHRTVNDKQNDIVSDKFTTLYIYVAKILKN